MEMSSNRMASQQQLVVAGVMAQFASELLGVSPCGVWEDARKRAGALDAQPRA